MIKKTLPLMAAPVALIPGGYVATAYMDATEVLTKEVVVTVEKTAGWAVTLRWKAPKPVKTIGNEPGLFVDACAILSAAGPDAMWMTMGAPDNPVEGILWRPDREKPTRITAKGLGTVVRGEPAADWRVAAAWAGGQWEVRFDLGSWAPFEKTKYVAVAIWQGDKKQRAGLKSVTMDWLRLEGLI